MNTQIIEMICDYLRVATEYAAFIAILVRCAKMIVNAFSGKESFI